MHLLSYDSSQILLEPSVITIGSFDGVHLGHQELLKKVCDFTRKKQYKSVVVTFDPHPQEVLQNRPNFFLINTIDQKIILFEKLGIDTVFVIPFTKDISQMKPTDFLEKYVFSKINVKAIFMGPNHHFGKQREGDANTLIRICEEKKIEFFMIPEYKIKNYKVRSTLIRNYLELKDYANAKKLMGHDLIANFA